jgi:2-polyprenyl-6-methoxyphenol hydroxylase-like FAD-dependent oxidoreductase
MERKTVLISGIGIGGPTLAYWLQAAGFSPTLVERAPMIRSGGYAIDFWGLGYEIAERMGLKGDIDRVGYHIRELRIVDDRGERIAGFGTKVFRELTGGRFVTLGRSDLSLLLFEKIKGTTEVIFGDEIVSLEEHTDSVRVQLEKAGMRRFDLVIGADGLHSNVRKLTFGTQDRVERQLGYCVAAFEVRGYRPRDEDVYVIYSEPGQMLGRIALHDDRTLFLFVFEDLAHVYIGGDVHSIGRGIGLAASDCTTFTRGPDQTAAKLAHVLPPIADLFPPARPPAIPRLIVAVVVDAIRLWPKSIIPTGWLRFWRY